MLNVIGCCPIELLGKFKIKMAKLLPWGKRATQSLAHKIKHVAQKMWAEHFRIYNRFFIAHSLYFCKGNTGQRPLWLSKCTLSQMLALFLFDMSFHFYVPNGLSDSKWSRQLIVKRKIRSLWKEAILTFSRQLNSCNNIFFNLEEVQKWYTCKSLFLPPWLTS